MRPEVAAARQVAQASGGRCRIDDLARTLAQIAAENGYADQAHPTREFRQMARCTPKQWLAEERRNIQDGR